MGCLVYIGLYIIGMWITTSLIENVFVCALIMLPLAVVIFPLISVGLHTLYEDSMNEGRE